MKNIRKTEIKFFSLGGVASGTSYSIASSKNGIAAC
jgi:hypothetical protein